MALEDRCSPQSAPSPPGLPQSPHQHRLQQHHQQQQQQQSHHSQYSLSPTANTVLDMSLHPHPPPPPPPHIAAAPATATMLPHPVSQVATNAAAAATLYHQHQQLQHLHHLQQLQQLHQQQLVNVAAFHHHPGGFDAATALAAANHAASLHQRLVASPGGSSTPSSTPASTMTIKEEESDSIMGDSFHADAETATPSSSAQARGHTTEDEDAEEEGEDDEEDDIDVDDVDDAPSGVHQRTPPPAHQQSAKPTLAFSISNILSDRFGGSEPGSRSSNGPHMQSTAAPKQAHLHTNSIFRPFDAARSATPSAFTRVDLLELSRQQQAAAAAATAAMMLERANFLNCFNPAAYPRIHEEIVNSRMRRSGVLPPAVVKCNENGTIGTAELSPAAVGTVGAAMEKSALGSLCKAVSQIGQTVAAPACSSASSATSASSIASPPPASNASCTSSSASSSTSAGSSLNCSPTSRLPSKSSSPQPIPPPSAVSRDSGMESSDDTRSETGSTTTEGGKSEMWPAWVYCTRYSDRPSSGE
ncbi:PREDICTED: segmentation polarity homeobox protein engrailed-like, partial [Rhagoletis zephyria]|uniref:segmentation polarity homeobox protein engrailed-like n=1 Tax=Rhagoletis zephyria TaxID=28612 RepID=UPI0008116E9A